MLWRLLFPKNNNYGISTMIVQCDHKGRIQHMFVSLLRLVHDSWVFMNSNDYFYDEKYLLIGYTYHLLMVYKNSISTTIKCDTQYVTNNNPPIKVENYI